jgi:putative chitinase
MAKMKVSGKVSKAKKKLEVGLGELERAVKAETEGLTDPQEAKNREAEIRDMFFTARKKTKGFQTGILMGLFGDEVGQALANVFAKEDPSKVKSSQQFFKKYKEKPKKEKLDQRQLKNISNLVGKTARSRMPIAPEETSAKSSQVSLKKGYYFDERIGAMGGIRNVRTGQFASEEQATKRKERSDRLTKAIGADEEPLVLLRERFDVLVKSVGKDNSGKTIHEKLDELIDQVESGGGSGFGLGDLLGLGGGRGGRGGRGGKPRTKPKGKFARATTATRKFFGGQQGRDAKGRFTKGGGGFGAGKLLAGGVGAAAGGYLAYKAVDAFRDKDLTSYDPEALKQEAIAAREAGDTEYTEALKTQIAMQKKDVALQAGATVASVAGAGVGGYVGVKAAQKIGQTAPAKKVTAAVAKKAAPIAKAVKNKTWDLFIKFLKARAPKLAAKVGTRLAAAGAMATIPVAGWVGAAISLGFAASTAYDLYQLWKEFSALSDAEKETAASGKPSKEVNNWAYSVYIGKAKIEDVPDTYREQVEEILKKPPSNWKKPGEAGAAKPQTLAGAAAAGAAAGAAAAAKPSGGGSVPSPTTPTPAGPAAAIKAAKEPAMAAGGGGGGAAAAPPSTPVSSGPQRRLGPAAAKRGKVDPGAAKNAALASAGKYGITGPHLAQFMAQLEHESGGFKTVEENLRYSAKRLMEIFPKYYKDPAIAAQEEYSPIAIANRVYANRMGNGPPESGDGYKYRGRGLIQLTGKDNYKRFGQLAGVDLVSNPDMAGSLGTAADIAAAFYKKNVMDKGIPGEDTAKVTKAINGGSIGLSHRESLFASYMKDPNALKAGPEAKPSAGGAEPEPSMVAKGQDVKIGGGSGGGAAPEEKKQNLMVASTGGGAAATATPAVGGGSVTPAGGGAAAVPSIPVASASGGGATAITTANIGTANIKTLNAPQITPKQDGLGSAATQQSTQYASNQVAMQAAPAPVVVNNSSGGSQQPITPPKQNMPKASARSNDNSFNRALARDFSHPSAFTSVGLV